ncbi:MAG: hypothetical protein ACYCW6_27255 [Candidatus Xenobia bacterium]
MKLSAPATPSPAPARAPVQATEVERTPSSGSVGSDERTRNVVAGLRDMQPQEAGPERRRNPDRAFGTFMSGQPQRGSGPASPGFGLGSSWGPRPEVQMDQTRQVQSEQSQDLETVQETRSTVASRLDNLPASAQATRSHLQDALSRLNSLQTTELGESQQVGDLANRVDVGALNPESGRLQASNQTNGDVLAENILLEAPTTSGDVAANNAADTESSGAAHAARQASQDEDIQARDATSAASLADETRNRVVMRAQESLNALAPDDPGRSQVLEAIATATDAAGVAQGGSGTEVEERAAVTDHAVSAAAVAQSGADTPDASSSVAAASQASLAAESAAGDGAARGDVQAANAVGQAEDSLSQLRGVQPAPSATRPETALAAPQGHAAAPAPASAPPPPPPRPVAPPQRHEEPAPTVHDEHFARPHTGHASHAHHTPKGKAGKKSKRMRTGASKAVQRARRRSDPRRQEELRRGRYATSNLPEEEHEALPGEGRTEGAAAEREVSQATGLGTVDEPLPSREQRRLAAVSVLQDRRIRRDRRQRARDDRPERRQKAGTVEAIQSPPLFRA